MNYTNLTWEELLNKTKDWFNLPRTVTEALKRLKALIDNNQGGGIESVIGDYVDNTDPLNPILNDPRPYKVYTALLSQSGTNAPVATVLENTLGNITFSRYGVGGYTITGFNLFKSNKTVFNNLSNINDGGNSIISFNGSSESNLDLSIKNLLGDNVDGMNKVFIEIRVYN